MTLLIPTDLQQLTPAWCTSAMQKTGALGTAEVVSADVEEIGQGYGFTGVVARVRLTYSSPAPSAPASVAMKLPMATLSQPSIYRQQVDRDPAAARAHYERAAREASFYQAFQDNGATPFPRCYYSAADPGSGVVLILEDLTPARHVDALEGCTAAEAWTVLEPLSGWHARWWEQPRLGELTWLPRWGGDPDTRQLRYRDRLDTFLRLFQQRLPPYAVNLVLLLRDRYAAVVRELAAAHATVIHGDLHLDNVLFHDPRDGRNATIIDWQGASIGPCALDAMLFVSDGMPVAERRASGEELLRAYHRTLVAGGVAGYSYEQFQRHGRLALLQRLAGTVTWFAQAEHGIADGRERAIIDDFFERGAFLTTLEDYAVDEVLRG